MKIKMSKFYKLLIQSYRYIVWSTRNCQRRRIVLVFAALTTMDYQDHLQNIESCKSFVELTGQTDMSLIKAPINFRFLKRFLAATMAISCLEITFSRLPF